jgi:hypothetical protein
MNLGYGPQADFVILWLRTALAAQTAVKLGKKQSLHCPKQDLTQPSADRRLPDFVYEL